MPDCRFYADEHIPAKVVKALRQQEITAISCVEAGMRTSSDEEHLSYALENEYIIVTQDADFLRLIADGREHRGIVFVAGRIGIGELISQLIRIDRNLNMEDMLMHVEFV